MGFGLDEVDFGKNSPKGQDERMSVSAFAVPNHQPSFPSSSGASNKQHKFEQGLTLTPWPV